jgi:hypothetical protein
MGKPWVRTLMMFLSALVCCQLATGLMWLCGAGYKAVIVMAFIGVGISAWTAFELHDKVTRSS